MKSHSIPIWTIRATLSLACALLLGTTSSWAVVIDVGDGTGNVTAPPDDPGFANVGSRGIASATYLGNRWVITASHVGAGPVTLQGTEYSHVPGERIKLTNPDQNGLSEFTDVLLFRLEEDPGLPSLRLPCSEVEIGSEFTMVGRGLDREPELSFWDVDVRAGAGNDIWTATEDEASSDRQGYRTQATQSVRWGQGLATLTNFDTASGFGDVLSFQSSFNPDLDIENLSQGVRGDSGGGVFQKNGGVWELIGMIHAVSLLENQPGGTRSAIYGGETYIADLLQYSDQIRGMADFEPMDGDFDANGTVDDKDIDAILDVVRHPEFASCHFDLVGENGVDGDDISVVVELAGGQLGDADLDGVVGFSDFLILSKSFGLQGTTWSDGDFDGNDQVTFADFLILSQSFGSTIGDVEAIAAAEPVPEPHSARLFLVGIFIARMMLRRRQ